MEFLQLPKKKHYSIINANVPSFLQDDTVEFRQTSLSIADGKITRHLAEYQIDAQQGIILPAFVDMHTHLDKGHIWPRAPNPDGTFSSALETVINDRSINWTTEDVRKRMEFSIRCAFAHGTRALRTHLDSVSPQHRISWPVFAELRDKWASRMELQAVTILSIENVNSEPEFTDIADTAAKYNGLLGCVAYPCTDIEERLEHLFKMASERKLAIDFHVDETKDSTSNALHTIAEVKLRTGFSDQVTVGHCCSLAMQTKNEADNTLDLVAQAGINVVSLPMCNMYLQDRTHSKTPIWRGVTLVHEMNAKNIPVCFASDNTRDPFYAYGDLDMMEVMREATRICHLDHSTTSWIRSFSEKPAKVSGFTRNMLEVNDSADFIVCSARNWTELLARPQADRIVVRNGHPIDRTLPAYSELDDLMEVR